MLRFSWSLVGGMLTGAMPTTSPALRSVWKIIWTKYVLEELATLIIQVAIFTAGSQLDWRETGQLPIARRGLKAALVGNNIILTGGRDASHNILFTSILSWDPVAESWQDAADLAVKISEVNCCLLTTCENTRASRVNSLIGPSCCSSDGYYTARKWLLFSNANFPDSFLVKNVSYLLLNWLWRGGVMTNMSLQ